FRRLFDAKHYVIIVRLTTNNSQNHITFLCEIRKHFLRNEMEIFWTVLIIQGIIFGGFCAFIASQKNRDSGAWFFLGFYFSILAVLALIAIPKENSTDQPDAIRKCPFCAEFIKTEAVICRFCQKDLPPLNPDSLSQATNSSLDMSSDNLLQSILMLRLGNFSYQMIAQNFNEKNVPIPEKYTEFDTWSPDLVKLVEREI
ncbi:MAG: hypothetical protein ACXW1Z_25335, partial [Methylobacter sp.]